jgi:pimeloyl-ACP methyl ester carboxylesterase
MKSRLALIFLVFISSIGCRQIDRLAFEIIYPWRFTNIRFPLPERLPQGVAEAYVPAGDTTKPMRIHLWYADTSGSKNDVVVYFHGQGENFEAARRSGLIRDLQTVGLNFVLVGYPGLGESTGSPNEKSMTEAGVAAVDFTKSAFPRSRVVVWGRSLGSGPAVQVANLRRDMVDRLVLVTPFDTLKNAAVSVTPIAKRVSSSWWSLHRYDSVAIAQGLNQPVLILHGEHDKVIPLKLARHLHESFPQGLSTLEVLKNRTHEGIGYNDPQFWQIVMLWLR